MGSKHRKLFDKAACELCKKYSSSVDYCSRSCKHPKSITFIVVASSLAAAAFLLACAYFFYVKCNKNRRARSSQPLQSDPLPDHHHDQAHRDHDRAVFVDEEHGPVVDHHIWYIRTVGLEQSLISSITVCQYKKDDGLVEGTECAVCLSEFQENETLRLLPKCDHAFHIPCIDTWLTSHTNCPMCRAPIVKTGGPTTLPAPPPQPEVVDANEPEQETEVEIVEIDRDESGATGGVENEVCEIGSEAGEAIVDKQTEMDVQPSRRSVSIDSSCANSKISVAISNVTSVDRSQRETEVAAKNNVDNYQKLSRQKGTPSKWRSLQNGKQTMKRSSSWNGKLLCMDVQNCDSVFPIRSF